MFTQNELSNIDETYFIVIHKGCYSCTVVSRSTGHYWHLLARCVRTKKNTLSSCVVYHRHTDRVPYHLHSISKGLREAITEIKLHDQQITVVSV